MARPRSRCPERASTTCFQSTAGGGGFLFILSLVCLCLLLQIGDLIIFQGRSNRPGHRFFAPADAPGAFFSRVARRSDFQAISFANSVEMERFRFQTYRYDGAENPWFSAFAFRFPLFRLAFGKPQINRSSPFTLTGVFDLDVACHIATTPLRTTVQPPPSLPTLASHPSPRSPHTPANNPQFTTGKYPSGGGPHARRALTCGAVS